MWDFNQPYFEGKQIPSDEAWRTLDDWRAAGKEIGVWFVAKSGSVRTLGTVESVRNGQRPRIEIGPGQSSYAVLDRSGVGRNAGQLGQ